MSETDLGWRGLVWLVPLSAACGWAMAWVFRRLTNRAELHRTKGLIAAHLLEFLLFGDEPALVFRAQRRVAWQCARLMGLVALPSLIVGLAAYWVGPKLDEAFARAPLAAGQSTVVTVRGVDGAPRLEAVSGIAVETPAVRSARSEWSWRVRADARGGQPALLRVTTANGAAWTQRVRVGPGPPAMSLGPDRASVYYESATILGVSWMVWFLAIASAVFLLR